MVLSPLCEHPKDEQTEAVIQGKQFRNLGTKRAGHWKGAAEGA